MDIQKELNLSNEDYQVFLGLAGRNPLVLKRVEQGLAVERAASFDEDRGCRFEPYLHDNCLGYKCIREDGVVVFITLNPSTGGEGGPPDVFAYTGSTGDPEHDHPRHYYTVEVIDHAVRRWFVTLTLPERDLLRLLLREPLSDALQGGGSVAKGLASRILPELLD